MKLKELFTKVDWATVCTVISCIGTVGTGVLASIGGQKMAKELSPDLSRGEKAKIVLKNQWPAIACGAISIGFDIFGTHLDKQTIAKLAGLAGVAGSQLADYRDEVAATYGMDAERDICERVNASRMARGLDPDGLLKEMVYTFYEPVTGTYFESTVGRLFEAKDEINYKLYSSEWDYDKEIVTVADFLAWNFASEMITDESMRAGWYSRLMESRKLVSFTPEHKVDRIGKRYWVIHWDKETEPFEDVMLEQWIRKDEVENL